MWDLANRDLPNPGSAAAWTITERLWYLSRATATSAFTCHTGANPWTADGCNTGSLWRTLRAADDDDGNLANGTPHSCQLFAAFDRHGLACASDPGANVCFAACTPPIVPALTAAAGSGQVAVSWSNAGAGIVYDVYRSELGCGAGFVRIADSLAGTSLTDTEVAGGNSYSYQVVAHPTGGTACAAAPTACQSATPTVPSCVGPPAPATPTATTAGVTRVDLTWPTVPAAAGYNVYRANAAGGPYALRATVAANAYSDTGLTGGTTYYYRVRAFANACESADSGVVPGATQACTRVTLYKTDFEAGSGLAGWGSQLLSGSVNDWRGLEACSPARSGSNVFRFGAASCTGSYSAGEYATAYTPPIAVPPNSGDARLSFWHRHSFEQGYDGGTVILSVDGGAFSSLPAAALSGEVYNSTIATGANTCPPPGAAGLPSFTGTTNTLANTVVELDPTCGPNGCALHSLRPGFAAVSDCFITQQGWYLDDVEVSTCVAPAPLDLYTLPPCRLIDTRNPNGPGGGPSLAAAGERAVTATGVCGVPASAKALALNVTVFQPGADGTLQVVPADSPALTATTTSFLSGVTRANNAIVGLASDGSGALKVRSGTTVTVDFILDVVGYFQ